jgi:hypothetical protein
MFKSEIFTTLGNLINVFSSLLKTLSNPKLFIFDIAVVGLRFHHFGDLALVARRLS